MKFCSHCGAQIEDDAVVCVKCGCSVAGPKSAPKEEDGPNKGFSALSFFFPLVGLILYLVWKDTYPLRAKSCGVWALTGLIVSIGITCAIYGIAGMVAQYNKIHR